MLLLRRLDNIRVRHVRSPRRPTGEAGVAGVDAHEFAVLGADVDSAAVDGDLRADPRTNFVGLGQLAVFGIDLKDFTFDRGDKQVAAGSGRRGGKVAT